MVRDEYVFSPFDDKRTDVFHFVYGYARNGDLVGVRNRVYAIGGGVCNCPGAQHEKHCKHLDMLAQTYARDAVAKWELQLVAADLKTLEIELPVLADGPDRFASVTIRKTGSPGLRVLLVGVKKKVFVVYVETAK